ncbi:hypothetical protein [Nitratidesulfovibrio termitidis]|uniref:hypothetical protein n=1 Tax=Nitratidesulfovibrio termitidis TaxID=42252 RepID=UPI0003FA836F|nr:hypothetical protein [Nitratidesulfovibrio termitidis]
MAGIVDIVNRALGLIGQEHVTSMDDPTPVASKARRFWPEVRDSVLRAHPWKSALRRARLERLAEDPPFGFGAQYQLPGDFLRLVETEPDTPRQIEGRRLLADVEAVSILYVRRETDVNLYDPQLREALAYKLASELAYGDTASATLAQALDQQYRQRLAEAAGTDAREGEPARPAPSRWVAAHQG